MVAVQEPKYDLEALRHLIHALGPDWGLSFTDVTEGAPGNAECIAFLFDTRRVQLSGLACEIVVPRRDRALSAPMPSSANSPARLMP